MNMRTGLATLLSTLILACVFASASNGAEIHVQRNGVTQFCAMNLASISGDNNWDFTGDCASTPPPPPPSGRITSSNVAYNGCTTCIPRFVGVTEWSAIWGHATNSDVEAPFPGRSNSAPVIMNFARSGYIAAHFKPSGTGPRYGWIVHTEYNYGADLTWAISRAPGDFNPTDPLCKGAGLSGQPFGAWTTAPNSYHGKCGVAAGVDYYLNIKLTNPAQGTTTCTLAQPQCAIGTANSLGP